MNSSELIDAIERVRIQVRTKGRFHAQKTPAVLLATLFGRLAEAVRRDSLEGMPLERPEAKRLLLKGDSEYDIPGQFESAWKTAVKAITDAMNEVRAPQAPPPVLTDSGTACIRYSIDHVDSFVIVEGPRINGDSCLQLRVRTMPIPEIKGEPAAPPLPHVPSLPARVEERLKRIAEQVARVLEDCDHNERRRSLITQHVLMVVKGLEDAALELGLGEIYTEYNEFALLSAQVESMQNGDELLGLTEWETDWQWWESDEGRRFREANEMAIAQGGVIRRIFLYATPERPSIRSKRRREMKMHREMGVEVGAISLQQVRKFRPAAVNVRSRCVLWSRDDGDGWLTYSVETSADGRPCRNRFSVHPEDVNENRSLLEEIWNHAHE